MAYEHMFISSRSRRIWLSSSCSFQGRLDSLHTVEFVEAS